MSSTHVFLSLKDIKQSAISLAKDYALIKDPISMDGSMDESMDYDFLAGCSRRRCWLCVLTSSIEIFGISQLTYTLKLIANTSDVTV
ncbi:MAG: hypothetical protein GDA45_00530 [Chromatiales bacterium]|nr:hypothetical protein [Chromatiales bacterium]